MSYVKYQDTYRQYGHLNVSSMFWPVPIKQSLNSITTINIIITKKMTTTIQCTRCFFSYNLVVSFCVLYTIRWSLASDCLLLGYLVLWYFSVFNSDTLPQKMIIQINTNMALSFPQTILMHFCLINVFQICQLPVTSSQKPRALSCLQKLSCRNKIGWEKMNQNHEYWISKFKTDVSFKLGKSSIWCK